MSENMVVIGLVFLVIVLYLASYKQREDFSALKRRVMGYANLTDHSMEDNIVPPRHKRIAVKVAKQILATINKETNQSYQITNFDKITVDEDVMAGGKPATRYTIDMFTVQPHQGAHDVSKRLILIFTVIEEDNAGKASNEADLDIKLKVQVESVSLANARPSPTKLFFDETDNK